MATEPELGVLLLEDYALVRAGMRALIQMSEPRATIQEAGSCAEALTLLQGAPIAMAFLDIGLREETKSGMDVLRYIRAAKLPTRVIMLSGQDDASIIMDCIHMGASGYISKGEESDGLFRRALDVIFRGGVYLPAGILGRGGFSPRPVTPAATSLDEMGVTGRAKEVLYYICQGHTNAQIAEKMGVTEGTIANEYNTKLFRLFRVTNRARLIVEVARRGIIPPPPGQADRSRTTATSPR